MKVLLLNPIIKQGKYGIRNECCVGIRNKPVFPSDLPLYATFLERNGIDVDIYDAQEIETKPEHIIKEELRNYDVIVTLIGIWPMFKEDIEHIKWAKELGKKTVAIINDSFLEEEIMEQYPEIDYSILLNDREITLLELFNAMEAPFSDEKAAPKNDPLKNIEGLVYRKDGEIISNGKRVPGKDLYHLKSSVNWIKKRFMLGYFGTFIVTAGRGCPFGCTFCNYRRTPRRARDPKDIIDELKYLSKYTRNFIVMDLDMFVDPEWCYEFADEIKRQKLKINWLTDVRADQCQPELLEKMAEAGLNSVLIGVETADKNIMDKIGKGSSSEIVIDACKKCSDAGIIPKLSIILGFPDDSKETIQKIKDLFDECQKNKIPATADINPLRPYKGAPIYDEVIKEGMCDEITLDTYINSRSSSICKTKYLSREEVLEYVKELNNYFKKARIKYLLRKKPLTLLKKIIFRSHSYY